MADSLLFNTPHITPSRITKLCADNGMADGNITVADVLSQIQAGDIPANAIPATSTPIATATANGIVHPGNGLTVGAGGALAITYGNTANTAVVGNDSRLTGGLQASNNLSELSATTALARVNLGIGSLGTQGAAAVAITGGAINGTTLGATTPAAANVTTLSVSASITLPSQTAKFVLAAPSGAAGVPVWRQLISSDISGFGTMATQAASSVAVMGGTIDGTALGATTPAAASVTTLNVSTSITLPSQTAKFVLAAPNVAAGVPAWRQLANTDISGLGTMATQAASAVSITGGSIDGTPVGGTTASTGKFTTLSVSGNVAFTSGTALALTATTGFTYLPTTAGVPTGTPTTVAGGAPIVVDTTDSRLYFYSGGAWQTPQGTGSGPTIPTANLLGGSAGAYTSITVSTGLSLASGTLTAATATTTTLGSVIVGSGLSVSAGTVSVTTPYVAANVLQAANNLSDVASPGLARMNIDTGLVALTSGATVATNAALGNVFSLTLGVNATLSNPTSLKAGAHYMWIVKQDATGGRTLAYGTAFKWTNASPPTLSTAVNQVDIISGVSDGTNVYCVLSPNFA